MSREREVLEAAIYRLRGVWIAETLHASECAALVKEIDALRAAFAAEQPEPAAWYRPAYPFVSHMEPPDDDEVVIGTPRPPGSRWVPLYLAQHAGPSGGGAK